MFNRFKFKRKVTEKKTPAVFHFDVVLMDGENIECTGCISIATEKEWRCQTGYGYTSIRSSEIKYVIATQLTDGVIDES